MRRVWEPQTQRCLVPEDWVSDARAPDPIMPIEISDANEAAAAVGSYIAGLRLARQAGQRIYLELRSEAQDLMARVARVALPYMALQCTREAVWMDSSQRRRQRPGLPGARCQP